MMKDLKKLTIGVGALAALYGCGSTEQRPNIVIFFADDLGAECLGCYTGAEYPTPRLNALSREGMLFENMNAQPLSTPSRVQLMTGQYNDRNYVAFGYMNDDENTFGHLAQRAGYSTAMVGKWQLGTDRNMAHRLGFDETFLGQVDHYRVKEPEKMSDRYAVSLYDDNGSDYVICDYGPDAVQEYAFDYIERQVKKKKPFLLYYAEPLVHTPHVSTPDSDRWHSDPSSRYSAASDTSHFKDMVPYLDKKVGEMADFLKKSGIWENTIFIFTADNGTARVIDTRQQDGSVIRGGKNTATYYGTHVPMIITWGDRLAGRRCGHLADLTDILPTVADAAGTGIPEDWTVDGVSLYPELCGMEPLKKELVLVHFNPLWPDGRSVKDASRYAMGETYAYFWDGRIYNYRTDPAFEKPMYYDSVSDDIKAQVAPLKARVDEVEFYPLMPGAQRRNTSYGSFYDPGFKNEAYLQLGE